jgi:hypothetical protein
MLLVPISDFSFYRDSRSNLILALTPYPFRAAGSTLLRQAFNVRCHQANTPGVTEDRMPIVNYPAEIATTGPTHKLYIGPLLLNLNNPRLFLFDTKRSIDDNT